MATNENLIPIPGRLHSVATEGHVAGADEIYDDNLGKLQSEVNASKADLVNGKVPSEQLPSYVDDVINGYYYNGNFYKEVAHTTVITGEEGKIYVDIPTDKSYRWNGSTYILISNPYSVDEEDLTVVNNSIKFKDRPNTDSMGKIILRKNIVSGVNTLTQSMINQANTIYVIQYDFDLNGAEITVPKNCALEFDGGSLSNGIVFSNKTILIGIPDMEKWFGAFKDINDQWLDQELKPFDIKVGWDFALPAVEVQRKLSDLDYNSHQSIAIDENYIYYCNTAPSDDTEPAIVVLVTDHNYNVIGYTKTNYNAHANGATVKDGYLIIPGRLNNTYYKISTQTIVQNSINRTDTTTGEVVDMGTLTQNVCYDKDNEQLCWVLDSDRRPYIYGKDGTLIKRFDSVIGDWKPKDTTLSGRQQTCMIHGIIYQLNIGSNGNNFMAIVDCQSEEVISCVPFYYSTTSEIEGIVYQNGVFLITFNGLRDIIKMVTNDKDLVTTESRWSKERDVITLHVDNTIDDGFQYGSVTAPFKYIGTALSLARRLSNVVIKFDTSDNTYYCDSIMPNSVKSFYKGSGSHVTIKGTLQLQSGSRVIISLIDFDGSENTKNVIEANDSYIKLINCAFKNINDLVGINNCKEINAYNMTVENCNMFISNDNIYPLYCSIFNLTANNCKLFYYSNNSRVIYLKLHGLITLQNTNVNLRQWDAYVYSNHEVETFLNGIVNNNSLVSVSDDCMYLHIVHTNSTPGQIFGYTYNRHIMSIVTTATGYNFVKDDTDRNLPFRNVEQFLSLKTDNPALYSFFYRNWNANSCIYKIDRKKGVGQKQVSGNWIPCIQNNDGFEVTEPAGATRPVLDSGTNVGAVFFDTTLGKPIYWNGTTWVDATGTPV